MSFIKYIADENHYKEVLSLVEKAKRTVWIGTADIKDLYVDDKPFLALIASLLKKGVEVRLIHAKEPRTCAVSASPFQAHYHRQFNSLRRLCKPDRRRYGHEVTQEKELRGRNSDR